MFQIFFSPIINWQWFYSIRQVIESLASPHVKGKRLRMTLWRMSLIRWDTRDRLHSRRWVRRMRLLPWSLRHSVISNKDAAFYGEFYGNFMGILWESCLIPFTQNTPWILRCCSASTLFLSTPHRQLAKYSLVAFATPHRLGNRPWCTASPSRMAQG